MRDPVDAVALLLAKDHATVSGTEAWHDRAEPFLQFAARPVARSPSTERSRAPLCGMIRTTRPSTRSRNSTPEAASGVHGD